MEGRNFIDQLSNYVLLKGCLIVYSSSLSSAAERLRYLTYCALGVSRIEPFTSSVMKLSLLSLRW